MYMRTGMGAVAVEPAYGRRPGMVYIPRPTLLRHGRRGMGAYATGICEGGVDTGDGSPCTPAVPGAQGGISTQALAAMNAGLNPGVAPITVADIIANGAAMQQIGTGIPGYAPQAPIVMAAPAATSSPAVVAPPAVYTVPSAAPASYSPSVVTLPPASAPPTVTSGGMTDFLSTTFDVGGTSIPVWAAAGAAVAALILLPMLLGGRR